MPRVRSPIARRGSSSSDDCDGAVCPVGQLCSAGECVADPTYTGGSTGIEELDVSKPACECEVPGREAGAGHRSALVALGVLSLLGARRSRRQA
jgi:hypothetical protein